MLACAAAVLLATGCAVGAQGMPQTLHGGSAGAPSTAASGRADAATAPASTTNSDAGASATAGAHSHRRTKAPSWLGRVDTLVLEPESISFRRGARQLGTVSLRNGSATVAILGELLGTASRSTTQTGDGGTCLPASTSSVWANAVRVTALAQRAAAGNEAEVRFLAATVLSARGTMITLDGPGNISVGDDIAAELQATPPADRVQLATGADAAWQIVLAPGWSKSDQAGEVNGVAALTAGSRVTVIGSPMPIRTADGC